MKVCVPVLEVQHLPIQFILTPTLSHPSCIVTLDPTWTMFPLELGVLVTEHKLFLDWVLDLSALHQRINKWILSHLWSVQEYTLPVSTALTSPGSYPLPY